MPAAAASDSPGLDIVGPKSGYSPQVGTLVSMLTWMREANGVISATKGLTQADLDHLFDANANSIGALMLHLAATETYYQMNTFDGMKWDSWSKSIKDKWDPAMGLGDAGRKNIKGHDRDYYLNILQEVRAKSLAEFKKRDDAWLMAVDKDWPWGSLGTNQQLLQVVPRLRTRGPPHRPDRAPAQTPARSHARRRVAYEMK
jgi:hypothetical protein